MYSIPLQTETVVISDMIAYISPCRKLINHLWTTIVVQMTWSSWITYSFIKQILIDNSVILGIANSVVSKQVSLSLFNIYYGICFFSSNIFLSSPWWRFFLSMDRSQSPCYNTGCSSPCNFCFCVQSWPSRLFYPVLQLIHVQSHCLFPDKGEKRHCSLGMHRT